MRAVKHTIVDKFVGIFDPKALIHRTKARMMLNGLEDSGYITPRSTRKTMKGINARPLSPNQDTAPKQNGSRALSRDMSMNTSLMSMITRRMNTNVVGAGLIPQPSPDVKFLNLSPEAATEFIDTARREFQLWADSSFAMWSGDMNFWDSQPIALASVIINGDAFFCTPWKQPRDSSHPYETRIKLIESDLVRNPNDYGWGETGVPLPGGKDIIGGIEYENGELKGYHVAKNYISEGSSPDNFVFVDAWDSNGRRQMFQIIAPDRIGQRRGMPYMASVLEAMKQVSRLSEAALMAAIVSSLFTVFVKDASGMGGKLQEGFTPEETVGGGGGEGPDAEQEPKHDDSAFDVEMGHANVVYLDDDKEIQVANPNRTDGEFQNFFEALVTQISATAGIAKSQLLIKLDASYSAARGEILETYRMYKTKRAWFVRGYTQPCYEAVIAEGVSKGRIKAPGYFSDPIIRHAWNKCLWIGPGMGQLDPLKEANASVVKLKNNLTTYAEEYLADRGESWEAMIHKKSRESELLKSLDIPDPARLPAPGTPVQSAPAQSTDNNADDESQ